MLSVPIVVVVNVPLVNVVAKSIFFSLFNGNGWKEILWLVSSYKWPMHHYLFPMKRYLLLPVPHEK